MLGMIGKKLGMTQIFDENGKQLGVTVLRVGPCVVTDLRTPDRNGYSAVQLGFEAAKEKNAGKAYIGTFKKISATLPRFVREIRTENIEGLAVGQELRVDNFEVGDYVDIQGISIGKGFQGVVKRHRFKGAQTMSHGTKFGREPGSVGSRAGGRGCRKETPKGKRMPGRMGNETVTVQNLQVVKVDGDNGLLVIKGAVPGAEGQCLVIRTALKRPVSRSWKVPAAAETPKAESSPETPSSPSEEKSE